MRISFISEVTSVDKAAIGANDVSPFWFRLLNFIAINRAKIFHMNRGQNSSWNRDSP